MDNAFEIRFTFQSEPDYSVPCHLLIPKKMQQPLPVMICLQGHSTGMHISLGRTKYEHDAKTISNGDRDIAVQAVKQRYCALTIEQRNFGECGGSQDGPDCYKSSMAALLTGRTTLGERVWDVQRAIDVLERYFPQTDSKNVMCMGNSGGGTTTFYAACLDERIRAAMPSCSVCDFEDSIAPIYHCSCRYFEMGDLGGLIAPRVLVIVTGQKDEIFPINAAEKTFDRIKKLYAQRGFENNCELVIGEEGHRFYAEKAWPVFKESITAKNGST